MTAPCSRLDDYLDGRLSDAEAEVFETHTLSCSSCDAALDASAPDFSPLRDVTCPPEVVEAALRAARRSPALAPDRAPARQRARRRFAVVPLALVAAVAVAVGLAWDRSSDGPTETIAEAVPPIHEPSAPLQDTTAPEPSLPASGDMTGAETDTPEAAAPDIADSTPEPVPVPTPPPAPQPTAPSTDDLVAEAPPELDSSEPEPTAEEVEAAREDLALAFHLVAEAQTQARDAVRAEATPLTQTIDRALPF